MTWRPDTPRRARDRARAELLAGPARSDPLIAGAAGCSRAVAGRARRELVAAGLIEAVPAGARSKRPAPWRLSATGVAIMQGASTTAEVMALAGCSRQAALKALKHQRHWPDDAAGARERLDIRRSQPCEWCEDQFVPSARKGGRGHRFCRRRCALDSWNERRRIGPRAEQLPNLGRPLGVLAERIPAVVLSAGLCATGGLPSYWTSSDQRERELARAWCQVCPVRIACSEWSVRFLPRWDTAVYAALDGTDRRRLRRAAQEPVPAAAAGEEITPAA